MKSQNTTPNKISLHTINRYILLQLPGIFILTAVLYLIRFFYPYPVWFFAVILGGWILKDIILFFFTWKAYEVQHHVTGESLIGKTCTAAYDFTGKGKVFVNGTLWKARSEDICPLKRGDELKITGISGLELLVKKENNFK